MTDKFPISSEVVSLVGKVSVHEHIWRVVWFYHMPPKELELLVESTDTTRYHHSMFGALLKWRMILVLWKYPHTFHNSSGVPSPICDTHAIGTWHRLASFTNASLINTRECDQLWRQMKSIQQITQESGHKNSDTYAPALDPFTCAVLGCRFNKPKITKIPATHARKIMVDEKTMIIYDLWSLEHVTRTVLLV